MPAENRVDPNDGSVNITWVPTTDNTPKREIREDSMTAASAVLRDDIEEHGAYKKTFKDSNVEPPTLLEWKTGQGWSDRVNDEALKAQQAEGWNGSLGYKGWKAPATEDDPFAGAREKVMNDLHAERTANMYQAQINDPEARLSELPLAGENQSEYVQRQLVNAREEDYRNAVEAQAAAQHIDQVYGEGTTERLGQEMLQQHLAETYQESSPETVAFMQNLHEAFVETGITDTQTQNAIAQEIIELREEGMDPEAAAVLAIRRYVDGEDWGAEPDDETGYLDGDGNWIPYEEEE